MKLLLALILTLISTSAMAEWTLIVPRANTDKDAYADLSTIRKTDNGVRMWNLLDFKTAQDDSAGSKYLSGRSLFEYDCKNEKLRMLTFTLFSDNMVSGEIVYSSKNIGSWDYIAPNTINETLYKIACGIK